MADETYTQVPGVDDSFNFPPEVRERLGLNLGNASTPEGQALVAAVNALLAGKYLVGRVYADGAYPPRIPDAVNVFIGSVDPGLAMADGDIWANPDFATTGDILAIVKANRNMTSTFIGAASLAIVGNDSAADATGRAGILEQYGSASPGGVLSAPVRVLVDGGATRLGSLVPVPAGDGPLTIRALFVHKQNALTGAVRLQVTASPIADGSVLGAAAPFDQSITAAVGAHLTVKSYVVGTYALVGEALLRLVLARNGAHANDTFTSEVGLLGLLVTRD